MHVTNLLSVIIPCYNQAEYLPDALESVMSQTYSNWECIIVNDGSTDNTEETANSWVERDQRFTYVKKVNGGLSSARNAGLERAKGYYIQFLDADDAIHPEKFEFQINALNGTPQNALSISSYMASTANDLSVKHPTRFMSPEFKTKNYLKELILFWELRFSIPVHCFLFKSGIFRYNEIRFNEKLPNHEDWDCWMRIFALKPEVKYIDKPLAIYRIREDAMSYSRNTMRKGFMRAIKLQTSYYPKHTKEYRFLLLKALLVRIKYFLIAVKGFIIHPLKQKG